MVERAPNWPINFELTNLVSESSSRFERDQIEQVFRAINKVRSHLYRRRRLDF
jgi:hypothetical protein